MKRVCATLSLASWPVFPFMFCSCLIFFSTSYSCPFQFTLFSFTKADILTSKNSDFLMAMLDYYITITKDNIFKPHTHILRFNSSRQNWESVVLIASQENLMGKHAEKTLNSHVCVCVCVYVWYCDDGTQQHSIPGPFYFLLKQGIPDLPRLALIL